MHNYGIFFFEYLALTPKSIGANGGEDVGPCLKKGVDAEGIF